MRFSEAMRIVLEEDGRVTRRMWSPGNFLMVRPTKDGPLLELYVDHGSQRLTWTPGQRDLHAEDWEIAPKPEPVRIAAVGFDDFKPMGRR